MVRLLLVGGAIAIATGQTAWMQAPAAAPPASGQRAALRDPEAGGLLIRNYPPTDYNGGGQNWALAAGRPRRHLRRARPAPCSNSTASTWRRIQTPTKTTIRSLAADAGGPDLCGRRRRISVTSSRTSTARPASSRSSTSCPRTCRRVRGRVADLRRAGRRVLPDADRPLPLGRRGDESLEADRPHVQSRAVRQQHALRRPDRRCADGAPERCLRAGARRGADR